MIPPGTRFGSYEVVALLGSGGMGEVYRARDPRLDRDVAIKVLRAEVSRDQDWLQRLHREARAVAALNHPHICGVYDVGADYLVMEYVDGAPLQVPLPSDKAIEYSLQILDALATAHSKSIIHRDLKPANLLVTGRGIKLLDFGIAAVSNAPAGIETGVATSANTVAGTPGYMAPEQMQGVADARTDIYAFGCVLYEMLTGKRPSVQRSPVADRTLERVIARCLPENPADRFQTAAEAAVSLRDATRPRPRARMVAVAAGVLLAAGAFAFWNTRTEAPILTEQDVVVVAEFDNSTGQSLFDVALKQALAFELAQSPLLRLMDDAQIRMALAAAGRHAGDKLTAPLAREVCAREGAKATLEGNITAVGSRYLVGLQATNCRSGETLAREQSYADSTEGIVEALATSTVAMRRTLGEALPRVAGDERGYKQRVTTRSLEALQAFNLGDTEWFNTGNRVAAIPFYQRATELDPQFAMAWAVMGLHTRAIGEQEKGKEYVAKAMTLTSGVSDRERLFIEALSADASGDEDKFIALHEVLVRTYPNDQIFHSNLAGRYANRGQWQKALTEAEAAIRLSPKRPAAYQQAANVLVEMQRLEDAKKVLHRAIEAGLDRPEMHRSLLYIATAENDAAAQTKELAWFKSPDAPALRHVANGAAAVGQLRKSEEYYRRAQQASGQPVTQIRSGQFMQQLSITAAVLGACDVPSLRDVPKPPPAAAFCGDPAAMARVAATLRGQTGPQAYLRGLVMLRQGQHTEAEALFSDMLQRKVANWGPEYPAAMVGLARAAKASGNIDKAKTTYEQFFAFWKDADDDVPLLVQARKEFAELSVSKP